MGRGLGAGLRVAARGAVKGCGEDTVRGIGERARRCAGLRDAARGAELWGGRGVRGCGERARVSLHFIFHGRNEGRWILNRWSAILG